MGLFHKMKLNKLKLCWTVCLYMYMLCRSEVSQAAKANLISWAHSTRSRTTLFPLHFILIYPLKLYILLCCVFNAEMLLSLPCAGWFARHVNEIRTSIESTL